MNSSDRKGWLVVAGLAVVLCLVSGPSGQTIGVFFRPLSLEFGFSRAEVARLATCYIFASGLISPLAGWLLDRIQARWMMTVGVFTVTAGFFLASHAHSLLMLEIAYLFIGIGVSSGTFMPATLVAVSWFGERRGIALGVMNVGTSAGLTLGPLIVGHILIHHSWRAAMHWLLTPMLVVAIPIALLVVQSRETVSRSGHGTAANLPGLDLGPALKSWTFWLIAGVQIFFSLATGSVTVHVVSYLIGAGFSPPAAATIFGLQAAFASIGYLGQGAFSDRLGARRTMLLVTAISATSVIALKNTTPSGPGLVALGIFACCYATTAGSSSTVMPMMVVEALGRRCFGSTVGILHLLASIGSGVGPLISGMIFDRTQSYRLAFDVTLCFLAISAALSTTVSPVQGHDEVPAELGVAVG